MMMETYRGDKRGKQPVEDADTQKQVSSNVITEGTSTDDDDDCDDADEKDKKQREVLINFRRSTKSKRRLACHNQEFTVVGITTLPVSPLSFH